jgi:hypothetical protein
MTAVGLSRHLQHKALSQGLAVARQRRKIMLLACEGGSFLVAFGPLWGFGLEEQ